MTTAPGAGNLRDGCTGGAGLAGDSGAGGLRRVSEQGAGSGVDGHGGVGGDDGCSSGIEDR